MNSFPSNLIISFEYNFFPRLFSNSPFNSTSTSCKKYLASPPEPMKPSNFKNCANVIYSLLIKTSFILHLLSI